MIIQTKASLPELIRVCAIFSETECMDVTREAPPNHGLMDDELNGGQAQKIPPPSTFDAASTIENLCAQWEISFITSIYCIVSISQFPVIYYHILDANDRYHQ